MKKRTWVKEYGLSVALVGLFLVSWVGQFIFQAMEVADQAKEHGQAFEWGSFWSAFLSATFENWQSEFLQLFTFVILSTFLIHKNSPQSRDTDDSMSAQLDRIEQKLNERS